MKMYARAVPRRTRTALRPKRPPLRVAKLSPGSVVPYLLAVCFFITATLSEGVPALRHDWFWPVERDAFLQNVAGWTSGWDLTGLGHPATHVAQYLLVLPILLVGALLGSAAALAAYVALIGAVIAHAAARLAERRGLGLPAKLVLTAFLCLNPWVYSELVAGHLGMLLAYGCTILVWTELSASEPDARTLTLAMFGTSFQPQFFAPALLGCLLRGRNSAARSAARYGAIAILPFVAGIVSHPGVVAGTPLTLTWEKIQSVHLLDAILVRGYFARYDAAFAGIAGTAGAALFAAFAVVAAIFSKRVEAYGLGTLALVFTIACFSAGTRGPLALPIAAGFAGVPAFGLYRELFDLVGLVAAGYAILAAVAFERFPFLVFAGGFGALLFAAVWIVTPPAEFWLNGATLPSADRGTQPGRYAFVPPFQPYTFEGKGSGVDPALTYRSLQNTSLNTYAFQFPEATALSAYWHGGSTRELARLGTTRLLCREGFAESTDARGVLGAKIQRAAAPRCTAASIAIRAPAPLFAIEIGGRVCSLCRNVGDGNVFFGDARAGSYLPLPAPRSGTDPQAGWIDARLIFGAKPELAQAFGGAFTSGTEALRVARAPKVLVAVTGVLRDDRGDVVAHTTRGYAWVALPRSAAALVCTGSCAVALEGDPPPRTALEGGASRMRSLSWHRLAPWLVVVDIPAGGRLLVRSLDSYDASWLALAGGRFAEHVRLDALLNGWLVAPRTEREQLVVLHGVSVVQLLLELFGTIAFLRATGRRGKKPARTS